MARNTNDGRGRISGRQIGTPNKPITADLLADFTNGVFTAKRRRQFVKELDELQPADRCKCLATMLNGVIAGRIGMA